MPSETQRWLGDSPQKITQYSGRQYSACGLPNLKTESNYLLLQIGEGNGTPLQYSCLENPMDGGAWWAAVHGVTTSWTRRASSLSLFTFMHWRRTWQPTPVFLPGESQGRGSPVGCCLWGHTELDTTEATWQQQQYYRWRDQGQGGGVLCLTTQGRGQKRASASLGSQAPLRGHPSSLSDLLAFPSELSRMFFDSVHHCVHKDRVPAGRPRFQDWLTPDSKCQVSFTFLPLEDSL